MTARNDRADILAKVITVLGDQFDLPALPPVTEQTHLVDDLDADDLDLIEIVMGLEEAFKIELRDGDLEMPGTNLPAPTVGRCVDIVIAALAYK